MSDAKNLTLLERLGQQLSDRDQKIELLEDKVEELQARIDASWKWAEHVSYDEDPSPALPVPRLEIRWTQVPPDREGYSLHASYCLVVRHLLDNIIFVPLGMTRSDGAFSRLIHRNGVVERPFRDGAHMANEMRQLKLRGFAICGDAISEVIIDDGADGKWLRDEPFKADR